MRKNILWFTLIFVINSMYLKAQNQVSFFEEHIDFTLDKQYFSINGIYSFYNNTDKNIIQQITFPFADKTATIDSIRIVNLSNGRQIGFERLVNSVLFNFPLSSKDTVDVNFFYRQKVSIFNKYIITSTQAWGRPLETAVYTLSTDKSLIIKHFSYAPDSISEENNTKLYIWQKYNFMPKFDFEITINQ